MAIALVILQVPSYFTPSLTPPTAAAVTGYDAAFVARSDTIIQPRTAGGSSWQFGVSYMNTGTTTWTRGTSSQVNLGICVPDPVTCSVASPNASWSNGWLSGTAYAAQTESVVAPGAVSNFVFNITIPLVTTGVVFDFYSAPVLAATGEQISADVEKVTAALTDSAVHVVTSAADSGAGTLRAAIDDSNAAEGLDTVIFNMGGSASIALLSPLPNITDQLVIDGTTQGAYSGRPTVELNGAGAGALATGLHFSSGSGGSLVKGLAINRFAGWGIDITAGGSGLITANFVGTDTTGTIARGNGTIGNEATGGIRVLTPNISIGSAAVFGGNIFSGNLGQGIEIGPSDAPGTTVRKNVIGGGLSRAAIGNALNGLLVRSPGAVVEDNFMGANGRAGISTESDEGTYSRNVVQNNLLSGIRVSGSFNNFDHNDIIGNRGAGVLVGGGLTVTANTFEDNNVRDNTAHGFELFNPAPGSPGVTRQNSIRRGSISGHTFEGILLDFGANEGIAPPTIETVSTSEGLFVSGTAEPNAEVDIYVDPADEGLEWIGTAHTSLDGFWDQGTWSVPDVTAIIAALRAGARVVHATQTDVDGNTSQFSSGAISGIAECLVPNPDGSTLVTLPGARVELYSGSSLVAATTADAVTAAYTFTGVGTGRYTVRYVLRYTICGAPLSVDPGGSASVDTPNAPIDLHNHAWTTAYRLNAMTAGATGVVIDEHLVRQGQPAWFKFTVRPGAKVVITLTNLPANYDLTLYKDITAAYKTLTSPADLNRLGAEFAPDAFSPDAFSPDAFSPDAFSPDAFSPDAFSPDAFSPDAFSPDAFSPDAFSPDAFSPDAFSPDAYSPDAFSPDAFSPDAFSPDAYSPDAFSALGISPDAFSAEGVTPDAFSPDAFSSAQTQSLIAVSAFGGTSGEGIARHTWDNAGDFYVRVRGRNGAFSLAAPFHLSVTYLAGTCELVNPITTGTPLAPTTTGKKTIVLVDSTRMADVGVGSAFRNKLDTTFLNRPEVNGVVVDVSGDGRVVGANNQARDHLDCPYAKNLVAAEIKRIVDAYRVANPLEYVVIVGNDGVIPFFRLPDTAGLASEKNFAPPVLDSTASQASLKLGYVLSQDKYGSSVDISINDHTFALPEIAVGRLVETAADAGTMIDAYLATAGVIAPRSALVTGYDFLADVAGAVRTDLQNAIAAAPDTLIENGDLPPTDPTAWTASQLGTALLGSRHDLAFLAGHFSASSALAADYTTRLRTSDVLASTANLTNMLIWSAGCHSGYNVVDPDGVPNVTPTPDWAQALAQKGATLVAGTGYQYGETELIEYSERLYLEFSRQLHTGAGAIDIGKALVAAKRNYIAQTAQWRGIHEKTVVEATLWGLPMLKINVPGSRLPAGAGGSVITGTTLVGANPGALVGLRTADLTVTPNLATRSVTLNDVSQVGHPAVSPPATYLVGMASTQQLTVANPAEPILPLELRNVSVTGQALRGVGFRGGTYAETTGVRPLTTAPATEVRGVRAPFLSDVFYPIRPWSVNYFDALAGGPGITRLMLTPAQFMSASPGADTGTRRVFSSMNFRLFYSDHTGPSALGSAPAIDHVAGIPGGSVHFMVRATGLPRSIQSVWITYTSLGSGTWASVDLARNATDSTLWEATDGLGGADPANVRYIVQAAGANGLVTLDTNLGAFYTPGPDVTQPQAPKKTTQLSLQSPPTTGTYREPVTVRALLTSNGSPLTGQTLIFGIGSERRRATTGADGIAETKLSLFQTPGTVDLRASFDETGAYLGSSDTRSFTIGKRATTLGLVPGCSPVQAILRDASSVTRTLRDQAVLMTIGTTSSIEITDFGGRAVPGGAPLAAGTYPVSAAYGTTSGSVVLSDERYQGSTVGPVTLVVAPSDVTTTYTGATLVQTATLMALSAKVTTSRSLAGAIVCFRLRDSNGLVAGATTGLVGADGIARASVLAPAVGIFTVEAIANGGSQATGFWSATMASALVAVFDPSTFVTGGGWVLTSSGSKGVPLTGVKANFGFNVKFDANNLPKGNIELKVNETKLTIKSTTIDWMVINGTVATFQGTATVNGVSGYSFRAVANDASPNKFEIAVWNSASSLDSPLYFVSGSLGGGSIQVH